MADSYFGEGGRAAQDVYKIARDMEMDAFARQKAKADAEKITMDLINNQLNFKSKIESDRAQALQKINKVSKDADMLSVIDQMSADQMKEAMKFADDDAAFQVYLNKLAFEKGQSAGQRGNKPAKNVPVKEEDPPLDFDFNDRSPQSTGPITVDDLSLKANESDVDEFYGGDKELHAEDMVRGAGRVIAAPFAAIGAGAKGFGNWLKPEGQEDPFLKQVAEGQQPISQFDLMRSENPDWMSDAELDIRKSGINAVAQQAKSTNKSMMDMLRQRLINNAKSANLIVEGASNQEKKTRPASSRGSDGRFEEKLAFEAFKNANKGLTAGTVAAANAGNKGYINSISKSIGSAWETFKKGAEYGKLSPASRAMVEENFKSQLRQSLTNEDVYNQVMVNLGFSQGQVTTPKSGGVTPPKVSPKGDFKSELIKQLQELKKARGK